VPAEKSLPVLRRFSEQDWARTLFWLSGSGLPHYFLKQLRETGSKGLLPREVHRHLTSNFAANQHRIQVMAEEFARLNHGLSDAGIRFAVVRGFDLAPEYCSELSLRTWYSHEYLLPSESLPRAREVIERTGFPFRRTGSRGELCFASEVMQPPADVADVYKASFPRMVVLHHRLWDSASTHIDVLSEESALQNLRMCTCAGVSFPTVADDAQLEFVVLDTFVRVLGYWCKLSWLYEIATFLGRNADRHSFWSGFYNRIENRGKLDQISGVVFLLASHVFGIEVPSAIRPHLAALPGPLTTWVENYGREWSLTKYPGSKLSLFLQSELVGDSSTWKRVQRRRLFPVPRTGGPSKAGSAAISRHETKEPRWERVFRRLIFHGTTTYEYLSEWHHWNSLRRVGP
jgi:hypothetical protein